MLYRQSQFAPLSQSKFIRSLVLLAVITGAHLGRLECDISHARETPHTHVHILCLHYVATFSDAGHGFRRANCCPAENGRGWH